jgi:hypothetical protein
MACTGGCTGWQQFIFDDENNPPLVPSVFIQYWLPNFSGPCPSQWMAHNGGCFRNSQATPIPVPIVPGGNLAQTVLVGRTATDMDTLIMSTTGGDLTAVGAENVIGLQGKWKTADFNVLGDAFSSQAVFNPGSTLVVRTTINDGTTNAPSCPMVLLTGETNNLTQIPPCCTYSGPEPAIVFTESNVLGATATCPTCTPGVKVLADTILSTGHDCFNTSTADMDFGSSTCDSGFMHGSCTAVAVNDGAPGGSTCMVTSDSGCACHVHATSPPNCSSEVHCHVLLTVQPIAGPGPQIATSGTLHDGADCYGTLHTMDFPATCGANFTRGTCSAVLLTAANGSTCTPGPSPTSDCGCSLTVTTPADCSKSATCAVIGTKVPTTWDLSCPSLERF